MLNLNEDYVMTIKRTRNGDFVTEIKDFSVDEMLECFSNSIVQTAVEYYDEKFLLEFNVMLITKCQEYYNRLSRKNFFLRR